MSAKPFIIRFAEAALQPKELPDDDTCTVRRVVGTVAMKHLLPLFHDGALDPNPRSARVNRVTDDVNWSLENTPELFANKSQLCITGRNLRFQPFNFFLELNDALGNDFAFG